MFLVFYGRRKNGRIHKNEPTWRSFMSVSVEEKVKQIVVNQLGVEESAVVGKAKFIEDLGADSLDIVELVMAMEEAFNVDIPDEEAENIRTVDDAISFIKRTEDA
jgi:acyl carrier protein